VSADYLGIEDQSFHAIRSRLLSFEREVITRESNIYDPIMGQAMIEPRPKPMFDRLDVCKTRLKMIDTEARRSLTQACA
jgi:hypothetical protein